jgi:hypothetical protein
MAKAILAFSHGNNKGEEHVFNVAGRPPWPLTVDWEEAAMLLPHAPVFVLDGAIHCCRSNCLPRNVSKTFDFSCGGTIASCHSCWPGNGKVILKDEISSGSDRTGLSERNIAFALDGREAMLAMMLSFPQT